MQSVHEKTKVLTYDVYAWFFCCLRSNFCALHNSPNRIVNQRKENGPKFEIHHFCLQGLQVINNDRILVKISKIQGFLSESGGGGEGGTT